MGLDSKGQKLVDLLLALKKDDDVIPNDNQNNMMIICLIAIKNHKEDEFIELIQNNSDKSLQEIMHLIFVEHVIDVPLDDGDDYEEDE